MKRLLIGIVTITTLVLTPVAAMAHGHSGNHSNGYHNGYHTEYHH